MTLVYCGSLGSTAAMWEPQLAAFPADHVFELPGHGAAPVVDDVTVDSLATEILQTVQRAVLVCRLVAWRLDRHARRRRCARPCREARARLHVRRVRAGHAVGGARRDRPHRGARGDRRRRDGALVHTGLRRREPLARDVPVDRPRGLRALLRGACRTERRSATSSGLRRRRSSSPVPRIRRLRRPRQRRSLLVSPARALR